MSSQKTALYEQHLKASGKIVDFAGWMMPIQYKNLKEEVKAVRENVGVFDVSHMGEFFIEGPDAIKFIDYIVTNDILSAPVGKAIYSPLCRENASIIDDLIVYKLNEDKAMICVNAANIQKDFQWIRECKHNFDCTLSDRSNEISLLAIQGPKTFETLEKINLGFKIKDIDYYSVETFSTDDGEIILARTGYTGEDGFEIFGSHEYIQKLWEELMRNDVAPCGLGARDVLRLEVCYPLYGNELNDQLTPYDCNLKWTVKLTKPNFIGKDFLTDYKSQSTLIKLILEKGIPRAPYQVEDEDENILGQITSGTMSVSLNKGIALARINKNLYNPEKNIFVNIRGKKYPATVVKKPFVTGGHK